MAHDHDSSRHGSGQLPQAWGDKLADDVQIGVKIPLLRRSWVRRLLFILGCLAGVGAAVALGFFNRWHDGRASEAAQQRSCLQSFLHSAEFAQFARAMDDQLVRTVNFIAARPLEAHALLPQIAARDKEQREVPWTLQVLPLPVSAVADPAKVAAASRQVSALLAQRGQVMDEPTRKAARLLFLRSVQPFAQRFVERHPGNVFDSIAFDRSMQEEALTAFAAYHGTPATALEAERFFTFYAAIGPTLWQAIERERAAQAAAPAPPPPPASR